MTWFCAMRETHGLRPATEWASDPVSTARVLLSWMMAGAT
jgi:hypothetical protein